jgi:hypothetical protein
MEWSSEIQDLIGFSSLNVDNIQMFVKMLP